MSRLALAFCIASWTGFSVACCCIPGDSASKPAAKPNEAKPAEQPPPTKAKTAEEVIAPTEARLRITIPDIELPADAPPEVRLYAETLVALERAKIIALTGDIIEALPGQRQDEAGLRAAVTKLATDRKKTAESAHADSTIALDKARDAAVKKAVDDATQEAKQKYPVPKDGPVTQRIKAQRDYDENAPRLISEARLKAAAHYVAPTIPKRKKK